MNVGRPPGPVQGAQIAFIGMPYGEALRAVTDLGLRPSAVECGSGFTYYASGTQSWRGPWWQPVGVEAAFDQRDSFIVRPTRASPPDWLDRLRAVGGANIEGVYMTAVPVNCPARTVEGMLPADAARYVPLEQVDSTLRVTFVHPTVGYDAALEAATELGLRLADPCYEQARVQGKAPAWQAMGQAVAFVSDGALVLAVGPEASERWREQAAAMDGVLSVEAPYATMCG